jgi:hypothetical protein
MGLAGRQVVVVGAGIGRITVASPSTSTRT